MKVTKKQLRRIVNESLSPMKSRATPEVRAAMGRSNSWNQERLNEMQSPVRRQAMILADLDSAIRNVEETADNMYGLEDPGDPGIDMGTEMSGDLMRAVEMLNSAFKRLEALFQEQD